jgi:hypothetical protein
VEHPGLGVQSRRCDVVRDADLCPEVSELLQRPTLGRTCVGRGQYTKRASCLAVTPQGIEQRTDAAASDERHDDVDRVRRFDLGSELVPQARLAGCVREEGRVEQGDERLVDLVGLSVGTPA